MNKNPFWMRLEPYNPNKCAERERRAMEEKRMREHVIPTLFDVQEYAQKTGRGAYARNIGRMNIPALDQALTKDISAAGNQKTAMRLRHLLLTTVQEGCMRPQMDLEQIKNDMQREYRTELMEAQAMERAGDDTEDAESAGQNWLRLAHLFDAPPAHAEQLLEFIEDRLETAYALERAYPNNPVMKKRTQMLRKIRTAVYWRLLHPDAKLHPKEAA